MSEQLNPAQNRVADDEIDLRELFAAIWQGKWIIAAVTSLFTVAAVVYALSLPNIYKSEALLAPVSEDAGLKIPGQLGGLAALAGVNLGGLGGGDKTALAMEIIKSREFLGRFI
uniref:Wzz/FepE/Etk N-terminal domain-containing protein n=1 Tax=Rheinheimera sp. TaxID=1869214 RepID=UPI0040488AF0